MIEKVGEVAYGLKLSPEAVVDNVLHIFQLKLKLGQAQHLHCILPALSEVFELLSLVQDFVKS